MFQPTDTQSSGNTFSQRLTKPRTRHNSTSLGKPETSSTKITPINTTSDYAEDVRRSYYSNDSPLSLTGSASFRNSESPSRSATNLSSEGIRSRNASTTPANTSKRHTIAVDNSDVDVAAAIALLQELKKRASPEDLILLHKALLPTRNVERTIAPSQPEKTKEHDEPISPLIRRSSLLPAGVKTRLSRELLRNYSENNVTVRSASVSRQHVPTESPRLDVPLDFEALDLADGSNELQGTRPATPSDFYPQIGTYKMGSLRITNGSASPEPARLLNRVEKAGIQRKPSVPESSSGEGFTTADEGEPSLEYVRPSRATVVSLRAPRKSSEQQDRKPSSDARARSKSRGPPVRRSNEAETSRSTAQTNHPQIAQRASEYAQEYASEVDTLENPHMSSPALTTTVSRLSTVHDESPVEGGIDAREEALRKLTGDAPAANSRAQRPQTQRHLNVARPPMKKSDSGYSSEASRRSIIRESNCDEVLDTALDAADQAERTRSKESLAGARPSLEQINEDKVTSPQSPYVQQISAVQKAERHRSLPSFFFKKSSSSTSVHTIAATPITPVKQSRKLQKSRPRSQTIVPEQVQEKEPALPEVEPEFTPGDPEDLSVNFSRPTRRLERGPSASPQTQEEDDRDARGRGRSRREDVVSQSAAAEGSPDGTTRKRSRSFFRFRSRSRSKSQHRKEEDIILSVADEPLPAHDFSDFGTIAQSLGQSPYDIATRRVKQMGPYDPSKPWFHPHELSRAAPKPDTSSDVQQSRGKSVERSRQDRARSQSRPRESIDAILSRPPTRGKATRSQSAHNIAVPRVREAVPELPKQTETMSGTFSRPASKDGDVRVGTIDFGTGFAQGRLEPILTNSEKAKTRRRTQSVAPRPRPRSAVVPEEAMPQRETPQAGQTPSSEAPRVRELPRVPTEKPSQVLPLELPQVPSRAPPKVPSHGKQLNNMRLSVSTKATDFKESTSAPHTPASPVSPAAGSSWESQALAWRERKQSINQMLSSPATERKSFASSTPASPAIQAYSPTMQAPRRAPTVVVSRYITPQGSEFAMHLGEEGPYRKLHSEDPYRHRSEDPYRRLHAENPTDLRPAQEDVERTDSSSTYRTATSERSQDSFASRDSAKHRSYRPAENTTPEKTQAPPTSRSNTTQKRSSRVYEQPQIQQQQPQPMPRPQRRSTAPPENQDVSYDRFSGGLGYGWERGIGFGGSAGTRQKNDTKAARKSVVISQNYGVDLSDVPVFMVRN